MVPATLIFIHTIYAERRSLKMLFLTLRDYNPFILIEKFIVILVKPESVGEKIQKIQQPFIEHLTMFYILFSFL